MTRLSWNAVGSRHYYAGVDHGVLYLPDTVGVPWPGLISVAEAPSGGDARPRYLDGLKYLNLATSEEFAATITAFAAPVEFAACEGVGSVGNGLLAMQQSRKPFHFSYRAQIGTDLSGPDTNYQIHLVYNALTSPSSRTYQTRGNDVAPQELSWAITTMPPRMGGVRATSHFVVDTRLAPAYLVQSLEDLLYGADGVSSQIPDPDALMFMFA